MVLLSDPDVGDHPDPDALDLKTSHNDPWLWTKWLSDFVSIGEVWLFCNWERGVDKPYNTQEFVCVCLPCACHRKGAYLSVNKILQWMPQKRNNSQPLSVPLAMPQLKPVETSGKC